MLPVALISMKAKINLEEDSSNGEKILSPMPGVFYSAQSPDKASFCK